MIQFKYIVKFCFHNILSRSAFQKNEVTLKLPQIRYIEFPSLPLPSSLRHILHNYLPIVFVPMKSHTRKENLYGEIIFAFLSVATLLLRYVVGIMVIYFSDVKEWRRVPSSYITGYECDFRKNPQSNSKDLSAVSITRKQCWGAVYIM